MIQIFSFLNGRPKHATLPFEYPTPSVILVSGIYMVTICEICLIDVQKLTLQIETYAYHLPHASLANLVDIFISLSVLDDSMYSLCHLDDFKFLADMVEHIKLPLKAK